MTTGASLISLQTYRLPVLTTSVTCHPTTVTGNQDEQAVENKHSRFLQKSPSLFCAFFFLFHNTLGGWFSIISQFILSTYAQTHMGTKCLVFHSSLTKITSGCLACFLFFPFHKNLVTVIPRFFLFLTSPHCLNAKRRPSSSARIHRYARGMNHTPGFRTRALCGHPSCHNNWNMSESRSRKTESDRCGRVSTCSRFMLWYNTDLCRSAAFAQRRCHRSSLSQFCNRLYRLTYHIYQCHILSLLVQSDAAPNGFERGFQAFSPLIIWL